MNTVYVPPVQHESHLYFHFYLPVDQELVQPSPIKLMSKPRIPSRWTHGFVHNLSNGCAWYGFPGAQPPLSCTDTWEWSWRSCSWRETETRVTRHKMTVSSCVVASKLVGWAMTFVTGQHKNPSLGISSPHFGGWLPLHTAYNIPYTAYTLYYNTHMMCIKYMPSNIIYIYIP